MTPFEFVMYTLIVCSTGLFDRELRSLWVAILVVNLCGATWESEQWGMGQHYFGYWIATSLCVAFYARIYFKSYLASFVSLAFALDALANTWLMLVYEFRWSEAYAMAAESYQKTVFAGLSIVAVVAATRWYEHARPKGA